MSVPEPAGQIGDLATANTEDDAGPQAGTRDFCCARRREPRVRSDRLDGPFRSTSTTRDLFERLALGAEYLAGAERDVGQDGVVPMLGS